MAVATAGRFRGLTMPGLRRPRGPRLLLLVYSASLVLLALTSVALVWLVSDHITATAINSSATGDRAVVQSFVQDTLRPSDLEGTQPASRVRQLERELRRLGVIHGIDRITAYAPDGSALFSSHERDAEPWSPTDFARAVEGAASSAIVAGRPATEDEPASPSRILREYLPIGLGGDVRAVFEIERDAGPLIAQLDLTRRDIILVTLMAGVVLSALLYLVFRAAQARLDRQTTELVESTRRDALTGLFNHGSSVSALNEALEAARRDGTTVAIGLLDIDNFTLLNDVHSHAAGDEALREVASLLQGELAHGEVVGRYGPDEFIVIGGGKTIETLTGEIEQVRERLNDLALQFGSSERLPVTVSAGVCGFPTHGGAATELLSTATVALREAKGSGGDRVSVAETTFEEQRVAQRGSFHILHSLVIAVDTKDRYTKRHSEDVARYALFLGDRLGLDAQVLDTLRMAGLLHDVGKIGVPDSILRKPDALTSEEFDALKQHVALGDLLVRDLPNIELVRGGIRHHHERWDGGGYLDGLAGDGIPYLARILSVADTFSAMTTSRPYRKALAVEEALERLRSAAGTQLDPILAPAFADAMENDPNAPMPGTTRPIVRGWSPTGSDEPAA